MSERQDVVRVLVVDDQQHRLVPGCKILMLTTLDDEEYVREALRRGASGYLLKDMPARDLAQAVQAVHRGIYQLDPAVMSKVMTSLAGLKHSERSAPPSRDAATPSSLKHSGMTEREIEVLRLIAQGATNPLLLPAE